MTGKVYGHPETCGHVVTATQSGYLYFVAMTLCGSPEAPSWCRGVTYREYSIRSSPSASRDKIVGTSAVTVVVDNLKAETWVSTTLPGETLGLHWVQIYVSGRNGQIGSIVAIDGASGQTRWTYGSAILTPKWSDGGPVVTFSATKTFVFVTGDDGSNGGFIQALEDTMVAAVPVWRLEYCGTSFQSSFGNTAPSNGIPSHSKCKKFSQLVASSTDVGATLYATCKDGYVYAIATTGAGAGTILWRYKPPSGADPTKYIAPSLSPDGQTLYYVRDNVATNTYSSPAVTHTSTIVVAINAADGVPLWLTPDIHTESPCTDPGFACDPNNTPVYTPDVIIRPATVSPSGDRLYVVLDAAGTLREISLKAMDAASSCAEKAAAKCGVGQGYTPGTSTTADDASCAACAAGSWNNADDTTGCAAKTVLKCVQGQGYTEGTTTANDASCAPCSAGSWNNADDTTVCAVKTVLKCAKGMGFDEGTTTANDASCTTCSAGSWNNAYDTSGCAVKTVLKCAQGKAYTEGTTTANDASCALCAAGSWNNADDKTGCENCALGMYQTKMGQTSCVQNTCAAGTRSAGTTSEVQRCETCLAGQYSSANGATTCDACGRGRYQTNTGQLACLPAICEAFTSKLVASLAAKGIETTCGASAKPFGATCSLQCSTGYALKTKGDLTTASCEVTDPSKLPSWSLTDLACAEDSCPPWDAVEVQRTTGALHIDLASLSSSSLSSSAIKSTDKFVIPGVIVPMVCLKGYNASGGFLCERGAWKLNDALCTPSKCMTGTTSTFGVAGLELGLGAPGPDGAASGSTADAKCKCNAYPLPQGYEAKGAVRCIRGEWLVGSALCAPKLCTAKTTTSLGVYGLVIGLGQSAGGGTPSGETVRAACRTGFVASGMVRCERGMWVAGSARCVESGCGVTSTDLGVDGLLAGLGGTAGTATAGTTVRAKCDTGFEAIGELKCTATGEWDASSASCGEAPCGTAGDSAVRSGPGGIEGLLAVGGWGVGTASGSSIPTQCSNGYQALGVVTCRRGSWETDKASCVQDNMCSRPILGSAFDAAQCMDNGSPGISSCLISCASGYVSDAGGRPGVTAKCASSGKYEWTESLVCKAATCAAPDKSKLAPLAPGVITDCPAGGSLGREFDEASIKAGLGGSSVGKTGTGTGATSCSFSCKEGFVVVGNGEATCVSEGGGSGGSGAKGVAAAYSGYKMECDPLLCEPPESMPGASSALTSDCPTTGGAIGSFCQVRCKPGYVESPYFCTNTVLPVLTIGLPLTLFVALYKIYLFLPSTTRIHTHIHTLTHTSYKAVGSSDTTRCVYASSTGIADTTDNTRVQYEGHALSCVVQLPEAVPSLVSVKFVSGGAAVQVDIAAASVASTNAISGGGGGSLTFPCDSVLSVVGGNGASWNSGDKESADGTEGTGDDCTWQSLTSIMVHVRRREESPRETVLSCSSMCACMQCFKSCSVFDNRVDEHHNTTRH